MNNPSSPQFQVRLPLILAATLAAGMFIGQQLPHAAQSARFVSGNPAASEAGLLGEIMRFVQARYVDTIDLRDLKVSAIDHLLKQLDPHSIYITPDEVQSVEDEMSGGFEGIGVEYILVDDTIQVVTPMSGGPSESAGILAGDKIITINDTVVAGVKIDNSAIFKKLRGPKGSPVKIGLFRNREKSLRHFNILRDVIPMKSVDVAMMLDQRCGYIKINRFSARTSQEFMEGLQPLVEKQGLQHLILDLRGNPGGYMNEAAEMLSQLFPEGKLLVYTKGRTEDRRDYKSSGRAQFDIRNVAVLIDEGSASASEIVAGAVQDHDRGWVLGRRSYGKGLVQEQYPLQDGGALRLTVSRYYTPSGRCIQREYKTNELYDREQGLRLQNGELTDARKIRQADSSLLYYTGMGRPVYGGGGITPDVFIPLDTSFANKYYYELRRLLPQFSARWMENRNRSELPGTIAELVQKFNVSDEMIEELLVYAEKQGVRRDTVQLAKCRQALKIQVKARIAKVLFQEQGLYAVLNDDDPTVEKALQLLRDNEPVASKRNDE